MARILDKYSPSSAQRAIKLHQTQDWLKLELAELESLYEAKKQKALDNFVIKANKKLAAAAYKACDKQEYADSVVEKKLQKYDVKKYLSHRAVSHKAAKAIFKAIKASEDWSSVIVEMKAKKDLLSAERDSFVKKLEVEREAIASNGGSSDPTEYNALYASLEAEYHALSSAINEKHRAEIDKKRKLLQQKLDDVTQKIQAEKALETKPCELNDDVLLSVKGLKMYFGGLKAVDDLTFDVKKGEIFGLIGPNGAGKTTVFNCITRFYDATGGDMHFENKYGEVVDLRNYKVHDIILQGIARTFQNIELVKEVSVLENLLVASTRAYRSNLLVHALGLPMLKREEKIMRQKAMRILKFMGLESYAGWLAFGLPYGILKKVEIARALMADARLIIMDEPAAGLNDSETAELTETIRRIRDEFGVTILLVEHDMGLVMNVCDTVCAISFGQMLAIGTTEEIQQNKAVQEAYLGVEEDD